MHQCTLCAQCVCVYVVPKKKATVTFLDHLSLSGLPSVFLFLHLSHMFVCLDAATCFHFLAITIPTAPVNTDWPMKNVSAFFFLYFGSGGFIFIAKCDAIKLIAKQTFPLIWANFSMPVKSVGGITYHTVTTYIPGSHEKYTLDYQTCIERHFKASLLLGKHVGFNLYTYIILTIGELHNVWFEYAPGKGFNSYKFHLWHYVHAYTFTWYT